MRYDTDLARMRVRRDPVCEARRDGRYCRNLAVSVELAQGMSPELPGAYRSRCPDHRPLDAPRFCIACHRLNDGRDEWRCDTCADSTLPLRERIEI